MKVVFFTEGGINIGFGHITRCLAISEAFKIKGIKTSFVINGDDSVLPLIKNTDFKLLSWSDKIDNLVDLIEGSDIVFVDSYLADKRVYSKIKKYSKLFVCLDDNNRINYPANIIINGNANAKSIKYLKNENKNYLLGSEYAPVRKEFWNVSNTTVKKDFSSILLTFGSGDVGNLTPTIIKILKKYYPSLYINVIIGSGYKNIEEIKKIKDKKVKLIFSPDACKIKKLLEKTDAVISASGQTVNEILRVNKPGIIISVVDNQLNTFKWLENNKILFTLNKDNIKFEYKLVNFIKWSSSYQNRRNLSNKKPIVDGLGAKRIVNEIVLGNVRKNLLLRTAKYSDLLDIFKLSNDSIIRKNSLNTKKINIEEHIIWFKKQLNSGNIFLLGFLNGKLVSQLRYEIVDGLATLSVSVNEKFRGFGVGKVTLMRSFDYLKKRKPQVKKIRAFVKKDNITSQKYFENNGFIKISECDDILLYNLNI